MSNRAELEAALWSILDALRGYAEELLLVGGWVPYLHLTYGRAAEHGARTSLTAEPDVVVPRKLPSGGRPSVADILGAFALNKANTFSLRGGEDRPAKSAKDLLYLRDIMAAGERARTTLEADLDAMLGSAKSRQVRDYIRRGVVHLKNVASKFHAPTAEILSERDGADSAAARADVQGHLTDLVELLEFRSG